MIDNITTTEELAWWIAGRIIRGALTFGGIFLAYHAARAYFYVLRWYWQDVLEVWVQHNLERHAGLVAQKVVGRLEKNQRVPYLTQAYMTITQARRECRHWEGRFLRQWWLCWKRSMKGNVKGD